MKQNILKRRKENRRRLRFAILACDVVCLSVRGGDIVVRLMKTTASSALGRVTSLPGGLLLPRETAEASAVRLLKEKGGIGNSRIHFEQLYTMSALHRDPSGRVVSVAYLTLAPWDALSLKEKKDTEHAWWKPLGAVGRLAYDHNEILKLALTRLRAKVGYTTLIRTLLSREFTLTELEELFELITKRSVDKRNFRRKIAALDVLKKMPHKRKSARHRPASLWQFRGRGITYIEIL